MSIAGPGPTITSTSTAAVGPWAAVAAVERGIRFVAYASAGDPARMDDMRMFAIWAGRLQTEINDAR